MNESPIAFFIVQSDLLSLPSLRLFERKHDVTGGGHGKFVLFLRPLTGRTDVFATEHPGQGSTHPNRQVQHRGDPQRVQIAGGKLTGSRMRASIIRQNGFVIGDGLEIHRIIRSRQPGAGLMSVPRVGEQGFADDSRVSLVKQPYADSGRAQSFSDAIGCILEKFRQILVFMIPQGQKGRLKARRLLPLFPFETFGAAFVRHIPKDQHHPDNVTVHIPQRGRAVRDGNLPSISGNERGMIGQAVDFSRGEHIIHRN